MGADRVLAVSLKSSWANADGPRHIFWNFVSSSKERIERAKGEWRERRFPVVPGDAVEFIPLPDGT